MAGFTLLLCFLSLPLSLLSGGREFKRVAIYPDQMRACREIPEHHGYKSSLLGQAMKLTELFLFIEAHDGHGLQRLLEHLVILSSWDGHKAIG